MIKKILTSGLATVMLLSSSITVALAEESPYKFCPNADIKVTYTVDGQNEQEGDNEKLLTLESSRNDVKYITNFIPEDRKIEKIKVIEGQLTVEKFLFYDDRFYRPSSVESKVYNSGETVEPEDLVSYKNKFYDGGTETVIPRLSVPEAQDPDTPIKKDKMCPVDSVNKYDFITVPREDYSDYKNKLSDIEYIYYNKDKAVTENEKSSAVKIDVPQNNSEELEFQGWLVKQGEVVSLKKVSGNRLALDETYGKNTLIKKSLNDNTILVPSKNSDKVQLVGLYKRLTNSKYAEHRDFLYEIPEVKSKPEMVDASTQTDEATEPVKPTKPTDNNAVTTPEETQNSSDGTVQMTEEQLQKALEILEKNTSQEEDVTVNYYASDEGTNMDNMVFRYSYPYNHKDRMAIFFPTEIDRTNYIVKYHINDGAYSRVGKVVTDKGTKIDVKVFRKGDDINYSDYKGDKYKERVVIDGKTYTKEYTNYYGDVTQPEKGYGININRYRYIGKESDFASQSEVPTIYFQTQFGNNTPFTFGRVLDFSINEATWFFKPRFNGIMKKYAEEKGYTFKGWQVVQGNFCSVNTRVEQSSETVPQDNIHSETVSINYYKEGDIIKAEEMFIYTNVDGYLYQSHSYRAPQSNEEYLEEKTMKPLIIRALFEKDRNVATQTDEISTTTGTETPDEETSTNGAEPPEKPTNDTETPEKPVDKTEEPNKTTETPSDKTEKPTEKTEETKKTEPTDKATKQTEPTDKATAQSEPPTGDNQPLVEYIIITLIAVTGIIAIRKTSIKKDK